MASQRIALAGATGKFGPFVIEKLVAAGFAVTILSRKTVISDLSNSSTSSTTSNPTTVTVDYASQDNLITALQGHEALICLIPEHSVQPILIDAAIAAHVPRFIPSEFGANVIGNAKTAALPVFSGKVRTHEHLRARRGQIAWTAIVTGALLDFVLRGGIAIRVKPEMGPTPVFDGGDVRMAMTRPATAAAAIVAVLRCPAETRDRAVYVREVVCTQNQLIGYAEKRKPGLKLERQAIATAAMEEEGYAALRRGDVATAALNHALLSLFHPAYGLLAEESDNELLGIKMLSDAELEDVVAEYV